MTGMAAVPGKDIPVEAIDKMADEIIKVRKLLKFFPRLEIPKN